MYPQLLSWSRLVLRHSHDNARNRREGKLDKKTMLRFFKPLFILDGDYLAVFTEQAVLVKVTPYHVILSYNVCLLVVINISIE